MDQRVDLFILACEPSGDLLGEELVKNLLPLKIEAVAGPRMRALPIEVFSKMERLCSMGFFGILKSLPRLVIQFYKIRREILKKNPKGVVFIDYPGFNLRLERSLRKKGYHGKMIHYVCPTVWAWGRKRVDLLEKNVDLLLCLFPFEKEYFSHKKIEVEFVGHPLAEKISPSAKKRENLLAIFPGSRTSEIEKNLKIQVEVAKRLKKKYPDISIVISLAEKSKEAMIRRQITDLEYTLIPFEKTYELMKKARVAIATSGTVTLELALHKTATLVTYAISPLDQFFATKIFKINLPYYCIVNILAKKEVFREFFGTNLTLESLEKALKKEWDFPREVPDLFPSDEGNHRAAEKIRKVLS